MRFKRPLSRRRIEKLKAEAVAAAQPHMDHIGQCVATWRDTYLQAKAALMLDALDERLVTLETPDDMTFADLLEIELAAFAHNLCEPFESDLVKLRKMFGPEAIEATHILKIEAQVAEHAVGQFRAVAFDTIAKAEEAANTEAERRGLPGVAAVGE